MTLTLPIVEWTTAPLAERQRVLSRGNANTLGSDPRLRAAIRSIIDHVVERGDDALVHALAVHDRLDITADGLPVGAEEIAGARARVDPMLLSAIRTSIAQCRSFNERIVDRATWTDTTERGMVIGEIATPIPSVGLFVPSGKGSYASVAIQIGTPAVVAGVQRITAVLPPLPGENGAVDAATLVALDELGVREIYRANGPAGIAALAVGTRTIPKVHKIVGPGSPAVALAQMIVQQYGVLVEVGLGPTDSAIIADSSADPALLAADLINEAEHGGDSSAVLISCDRALLERAAAEAGPQLERLPDPRRTYAIKSIRDNGGLIVTANDDQAVAIANAYAPEHLQLAVADPAAWLAKVSYAGTTLLGQWTTFAMSNFATGTPATLPTSGFARVSSGVTASTYLARTAVAGLDEREFRRLTPTVLALAGHEDFPGHAATVAIREREER